MTVPEARTVWCADCATWTAGEHQCSHEYGYNYVSHRGSVCGSEDGHLGHIEACVSLLKRLTPMLGRGADQEVMSDTLHQIATEVNAIRGRVPW